MRPFVDDADFQLYVGDALTVLRELPDESVDCVVTSPPYWGLRDYGTGEWAGGDENCDHSNECPCGARRVDQQLGLEPTPDQYVTRMVQVFREVRRVLAAHGTCWVNLGDSYASSPPGNTTKGVSAKSTLHGVNDPSGKYRDTLSQSVQTKRSTVVGDLKPKDLVGIPWRVAFALQADGWYLRSDIIWSKPNPMPESVTDRPTKAHEYIFLLTKSPRYWFDQEAVREPNSPTTIMAWGESHPRQGSTGTAPDRNDHVPGLRGASTCGVNPAGRNIRSVWEIATQPYPEAHFATYPEELVRRCLLAGCPVRVCRVCGAPRERIVELGDLVPDAPGYKPRGSSESDGLVQRGMGWRSGESAPNHHRERLSMSWSDCGCGRVVCQVCGGDPPGRCEGCDGVGYLARDNYRPGVVLDPFLGSGTTALVARNHNRHAIGIELSAEYAELAAKRTRQLSLLTEGNAA